MKTSKLEVACLMLSFVIVCGALALNITTIVREEWVRFEVSSDVTRNAPPSATAASRCYYTRNRGVFFECLEVSEIFCLGHMS